MFNLDQAQALFVLPDLRQIQLRSVRHFLQVTLLTELRRLENTQAVDRQRFQLQLVGGAYRLESPRLNEREAVYTSSTYASNLYVPAHLIDAVTGETQTEIVWLGSIPLVDSSGTFVINGVSRCVISQVLRAPGVYYTFNSERTHVATIICNSGRRLRLELDARGGLSVRITRQCKISVVLLLFCMGLKLSCIPLVVQSRTKKLDELLDSITDAERQLHNTLDRLCLQASRAQRKQRLRASWQQPAWQELFVKPYDLGLTGRFNLNKTLYTQASAPKQTEMLARDIISITEGLLRAGASTLAADDIDELRHKYVRSVGDAMYEQLMVSLKDFKATVTKRMHRLLLCNPLPSPRRLVGATPLTITLNQFFASCTLSQFLDQTNPLADMVHKRRLSALGPGGLTPRTATLRARDIHPSQYGRVCPVDTAEGQNAGIVTSLTVCAELDSIGMIQNPLCGINTMSARGCRAHAFSASEDEYYQVSTDSCLAVIQSVYDRTMSSAQYRRELTNTPWGQVHLRSILPIHYFAVGITLIPFLEHDDATRALMGSNMQRQAVPLLNPEKPIVGTGLEAQVALDSGTVVTATIDGTLGYVDGERILHSQQESVGSDRRLSTFGKSNNNTCIHQRAAVYPHELIRRGQLLADGASTANGELALGKNVLVAYMPWDGYNFEDAVLISERLVCEQAYTSLHIKRYETEARQTAEGDEIITGKIPYINQHLLRHLDERGVVSVGAWVESGDVLVGKVAPQVAVEATPESKLLQAIFGTEAPHTKETCLKVPPREGGRVIDVRWVIRESSELEYSQLIHIYVLQRRKIQVGDKVAGRHGNKGVVSRILRKQDMPYLQDGTPIDMVLSPLGVPSRMNVGQVFECLLGISGARLNKHYRIMPFDERYEQEASRKLVLSELYKARHQTGFPWLLEYDSPGKSQLFDGRTGNVFEQPVTVGRAYMLKLIHQVDDKMHARCTGPYALVTQQPLRGKARQGGQRLGEMEVWALQGFGAAHVLQEMILEKSDHVRARSETFSAIAAGHGTIPNPIGPQDSLRLLVRELRCLGININHAVVSRRDLTVQSNEI